MWLRLRFISKRIPLVVASANDFTRVMNIAKRLGYVKFHKKERVRDRLSPVVSFNATNLPKTANHQASALAHTHHA